MPIGAGYTITGDIGQAPTPGSLEWFKQKMPNTMATVSPPVYSPTPSVQVPVSASPAASVDAAGAAGVGAAGVAVPPQGIDVLGALLDEVSRMTGPTQISKEIATTKEARSPELEARTQQFIDTLNQMSEGYRTGYGNLGTTFDAVIRNLMNVNQVQAGRSAGATSTAALASGLTPLEASKLSGDAMQSILQAMYPQIATLRQQQAEVPIQLQDSLRGLNQDYLEALSSVIAPYQRAVAGTTTEGTREITDILGRMGLKSDVASKLGTLQQGEEQIQLGWAQLMEDARQKDLSADLQKRGFNVQQAIAMLEQEGMDRRTAMQMANSIAVAQIQSATNLGTARIGSLTDLTRTGMTEAGALQRLGISEGGEMSRLLTQLMGNLGLQNIKETAETDRLTKQIASTEGIARLPYEKTPKSVEATITAQKEMTETRRKQAIDVANIYSQTKDMPEDKAYRQTLAILQRKDGKDLYDNYPGVAEREWSFLQGGWVYKVDDKALQDLAKSLSTAVRSTGGAGGLDAGQEATIDAVINNL